MALFFSSECEWLTSREQFVCELDVLVVARGNTFSEQTCCLTGVPALVCVKVASNGNLFTNGSSSLGPFISLLILCSLTRRRGRRTGSLCSPLFLPGRPNALSFSFGFDKCGCSLPFLRTALLFFKPAIVVTLCHRVSSAHFDRFLPGWQKPLLKRHSFFNSVGVGSIHGKNAGHLHLPPKDGISNGCILTCSKPVIQVGAIANQVVH